MDATVAQTPRDGIESDNTGLPSAYARPVQSTGSQIVELVVLLLGVAVVALPTMFFVAKESWSTEQGSHGPIVLFTGLWLLWRQWPEARAVAQQPSGTKVALLLAFSLSLYTFTRITQIVEIEGYAMYACLLVVLYSMVGHESLRRLWFPLFYLAFIFPPPETLVAAVTLPMKIELSKAAVSLLHTLGYPIGGEGVKIYIGQYELLVAAACSGLNSIISLTAISLFYIYIRHQAEWRYAALLGCLIIPVALLANFVRVLMLILVTYYFGEAAAQGFLHNTAGVVMFAVALVSIYLADEAIRALWLRHAGERAGGLQND
uniref:exosortase V n=1 Tax=Altererythrobacter segetis TaxID=1104773 RepID=UPI00140B51F0|nr:exosortase V [Altererythrobacter segetis]